jgi:hypothetical protein
MGWVVVPPSAEPRKVLSTTLKVVPLPLLRSSSSSNQQQLTLHGVNLYLIDSYIILYWE